MNCQTRFIGKFLHHWVGTIHYPPGLSDGEGGCWAGHRIFECSSCHKKYSDGIWAAGCLGGDKLWSRMRKARPEELAEHGL